MEAEALVPWLTPALIVALAAWLRSDLRDMRQEIRDLRRDFTSLGERVANLAVVALGAGRPGGPTNYLDTLVNATHGRHFRDARRRPAPAALGGRLVMQAERVDVRVVARLQGAGRAFPGTAGRKIHQHGGDSDSSK